MTKKIQMKKKSRKLKYRRILLFFLVIIVFVFLLVQFCNKKITNIYIHNNKYIFTNFGESSKYNEQTLIDLSGISNYPTSLFVSTSQIKKKLLKNAYIKDAKVYRKNIFEIHIYIEENRPLFYYSNINKTVLENQKTVDDIFNIPTLVNYVPDNIYDKFVKCMNNIDDDTLNHTSEIKYDPNNLDEERFLFTMTDGNYVYITLSRFDLINNYLAIIKKVGDKKGILYLDYGDHFVFE